ncbi:MAG: tyrosine-type recombinase/integrase [Dechloromonas sp.]|nr:tyrosine-type recombinase/integrase [Dechloromonas sp.]MBN8555359.1 tyrosine-type recombinase/integrase [Deltaproteobacteria bacterium]
MAKGAGLKPQKAPHHPLLKALNAYLEELQSESRLAASTLQLYSLELNQLLLLLSDTKDLSALRKYLATKSAATHLRKLVIWKSFLKTCDEPWSSLLDNLRQPKVRQKQPLFLTEEEQFRLETVCYKSNQQIRDRLFIALALQLGLRLREILNLKFKDVEAEWIKLSRKGGKEQRLPLSPALRILVQSLKKERHGDSEDYLFVGKSDQALTSRAAQLILEKLRKMAGIQKKITPHSLRHTFATTLAARGASLVALKELLGHQKLSTTERYLHVTPAHLQETLSLLNVRATEPQL